LNAKKLIAFNTGIRVEFELEQIRVADFNN